jgi:lipid II:glycine glycyltransferase (peptidoglycan interpeptide bridge formation enzyme)
MTNLLSDEEARQWDASQQKRQASFLQSSLWGKFQAAAGSPPHFLMQTGWSCLLLERRTKLGNCLFAPYGPTLASAAELKSAVTSIKNYAADKKFDWLIIEPVVPGSDSRLLTDELIKLGAKRSSHKREPDLTRVIDLKPAPDKLLASISQSTRSYIRKNQRQKFIGFKTLSDPADIRLFTDMLKQVTERNRVRFFPDDYFITEAKTLMPAGMMYLEIALLQDGQPAASALFHDYGRLSTYTFAASLPAARSTNASALLLWQGMLNAKDRGMEKMDLYGIAPDDAPHSHPWAGFTSFKKKFGGEIIQLAGTWDIPLTGRYRLYRAAQSGRRLARRH